MHLLWLRRSLHCYQNENPSRKMRVTKGQEQPIRAANVSFQGVVDEKDLAH
jgi:hypothetical protein